LSEVLKGLCDGIGEADQTPRRCTKRYLDNVEEDKAQKDKVLDPNSSNHGASLLWTC